MKFVNWKLAKLNTYIMTSMIIGYTFLSVGKDYKRDYNRSLKKIDL